MKLIFSQTFLLLINLISFSQVKKVSLESRDSVLLSTTNFRLVGPFRGGRASGVAGVIKIKILFTSLLQVVAFGKQQMEEAIGKIFLINFLVVPSVVLLWRLRTLPLYMQVRAKLRYAAMLVKAMACGGVMMEEGAGSILALMIPAT